MVLSELEELAKRHGALSYRNRADTQNPAFGFSAAGLASLVAAVRKDDTDLIRQMLEALETCTYESSDSWVQFFDDRSVKQAITAARARLEGRHGTE